MQEDQIWREKASEPLRKAEVLHPRYRGKIEILPKVPVSHYEYFSVWYTPGVSSACKKILENSEKSFEYTSRWNTIAVVSDGTRVLGLGNIGPEAGLPVMEGKSLLFKYLGGVDAFPICISEKDPDRIISIVKALEPTFGGINLEDIEKPKCFHILERLRNELSIPVWHDDQQGTATVILAALINAAEIANKSLENLNIFILGAGSAGIATLRLLISAGLNPQNIVVADRKGLIHRERDDLEEKFGIYRDLLAKTNGRNRKGDFHEGFAGADVFIGLSTPGPGVVRREDIKKMSKDAIVFTCANPTPEIWPWEAKEAGAKIVATGRSDFPNQVNNSIVFPGIFRGVLDVSARTISDSMCLKVAQEIAKYAKNRGINEEYIIPGMDEWEVFPRVAATAADTATKEGVARKPLSFGEELENATQIITRTRKLIENLETLGYIENYFT
ncbi:MAG TPA: NADP-dependent malic enzyme [Candidatus Hydrothermia bacterium]|nr:NADP-dependent malic enzyme [Candidatus Hydrothermia bacterium]